MMGMSLSVGGGERLSARTASQVDKHPKGDDDISSWRRVLNDFSEPDFGLQIFELVYVMIAYKLKVKYLSREDVPECG